MTIIMLTAIYSQTVSIKISDSHKDVTTTIRTYNSVDRSYFKQAVDKLDSKFHFDDN